jgi:hypothetical protein
MRVVRLSPSSLARHILCPAYVAAPFNKADRFRFQAWHAITVLKVISRHLKHGYQLRGIERAGNGFRIDLLFESPSGELRLGEVKSARELRDVHRIQAALYWRPECDEVVLSNSQTDVVLSLEYVQSVQEQARATKDLLLNHPEIAARSFNPNADICPTCANLHCRFWLGRSSGAGL